VEAHAISTNGPALLLGTVLGLALSVFAPAKLLTRPFAGIAAALAVKMVLGERLAFTGAPLKGLPGQLSPAIVEHARAVALLFPIKQAIGAVALFNLVIALPAAAFFLTHDHGTPGRPLDALGDVALFCVAALSLPALFVAPLAARWSARAPVSLLRRLFALCLAVIAVRLLLRP